MRLCTSWKFFVQTTGGDLAAESALKSFARRGPDLIHGDNFSIFDPVYQLIYKKRRGYEDSSSSKRFLPLRRTFNFFGNSSREFSNFSRQFCAPSSCFSSLAALDIVKYLLSFFRGRIFVNY